MRDGILLERASSGCTVKNNKLLHVSQAGMDVRGSNHIIESNEISGTIQYPPELKADSYWGNTTQRVADADCFRFFGVDHVFKNNYCHDISYGIQYGDQGVVIGENIDPHTDGFQTWGDASLGIAHDIVFDGNTIILQGSGGGFTNKSIQMAGGAYNITFKNNVFRTTLGALFTSAVSNIILDHNTWVGDKTNSGTWGVDSTLCTTGCVVTNNIFAYHRNGVGYLRTAGASTTANNNCVYQTGGSRPTDPGDIRNQDPLFTNESVNNFTLQLNSPYLGKGAISTSSSATKPGDLNDDNEVNLLDYNLLVAGYGTKYTIFDYNTLVSNYGK